MLEQPPFDRPAFRAAARNDLGIVYISSGHDMGMDDDKNPDHPIAKCKGRLLQVSLSSGR